MKIFKFKDFLEEYSVRQGDSEAILMSLTNEGIIPRIEKYNRELSNDYTKNKLIQKGMIAFGNSRHTLNYGVLLDDVTGSVSNVYNIFKIDDSIVIPKYLQLYFEFNRHNMLHLLKPGARDNRPIDKELLFESDIPIPSIGEQVEIINVISKIESLIKNNIKIIKMIKMFNSGLFKHYFIDFNFMDLNGLPYKENNGEMIQSNLGEIPKGWKVMTVDDISSYNKKGFNPVYTMNDEPIGTPIINQRCVRDNTIYRESLRYNDDSIKQCPQDKYHQKWDVLVNSMGVGTLGRVAVSSVSHEMIVLSVITILRANTDLVLNPIYSLLMLNLEETFTNMGRGSTGQTTLNNKMLGQLELIIPPIIIQEQISSVLEKMQDKIDRLYKMNNSLVFNRRELLGKLIKS